MDLYSSVSDKSVVGTTYTLGCVHTEHPYHATLASVARWCELFQNCIESLRFHQRQGRCRSLVWISRSNPTNVLKWSMSSQSNTRKRTIRLRRPYVFYQPSDVSTNWGIPEVNKFQQVSSEVPCPEGGKGYLFSEVPCLEGAGAMQCCPMHHG